LKTYLIFYGEEERTGGALGQGVPFFQAARDKRDEIWGSPDFDGCDDEVHIIRVNGYLGIETALEAHRDIQEIYIYTHARKDILHLSTSSTRADGNISADGKVHERLVRRLPWPKWAKFKTTSFKGLSRKNLIQGGQLYVYGCYTDSIAKEMGSYLFGVPGIGISTSCYFPEVDGITLPMDESEYRWHYTSEIFDSIWEGIKEPRDPYDPDDPFWDFVMP